MQRLILQNIKILAYSEDSKSSLYSKKTDGILDLFTYFNTFAAKKWFKFTKITNLHLYVHIEGTADISIVGCNEDQKTTLLHQPVSRTFDTEIRNPDYDLIAISFQNISQDFELKCGFFYTLINSEEIKKVDLGIAICTYKREQYLFNNLALLQKDLLENKNSVLQNHLQIYVADNGNTIKQSTLYNKQFSNSSIKVFDNINAGGTAGFTRCIIEYLKSENQPTHILFMDDDATFDTESIERTFTLLSIIKDDNKNDVIGGAMLKEEHPCIQEVCGNIWNNFLNDPILIGQNIDLTTQEGILKSQNGEEPNYNAWFYCCMPTAVIKEKRLPLPFFIHYDDVEYGIRLKQKVILLNGICVWHPTEGKYSPSLRFYDSRNRILATFSSNDPIGKKALLCKNLRSFIDCLSLYKYLDWSMYYQGCLSVLNKKSCCLDMDPQKLHVEISKKKHQIIALNDVSCTKETLSFEQQQQHILYTSSVNIIRIIDVFISFAILFLPSFKKDICQMNSSPYLYSPSFRGRKRVYVYSENQECFVLEKSLSKTLKATLQFIHLNILTIFKFNAAKKDFANNFKRLTSLDFWTKYLQLDK